MLNNVPLRVVLFTTFLFCATGSFTAIEIGEKSVSINNAIISLIALFFLCNKLVKEWKLLLPRYTYTLYFLLGLLFLSSIYSLSPFLTISKWLVLISVIYVCYEIEWSEARKAFRGLVYAFLILNVLFIAILPSSAIMSGLHEGALMSFYTQKNVFGRAVLVVFILADYLLENRPHDKIVKLLLLFLLFFSQSATSLLLLILYLSINYFIISLDLRQKIIVSVLGTLFLSVLLFNLAPILNYFGRDLTLTGRVPIWILAFEEIQESFLLGYGYGAFWIDSGPAVTIWNNLPWEPNDSHNGYIDILLQVGFVGLIIYFYLFFKTFFNLIKFSKKNETRFISFLVIFGILNLTESVILRPTNIYWLILVLLYFEYEKRNITHSHPQRSWWCTNRSPLPSSIFLKK